jgi:ElaB/YqjD/DUF883 family membrane-anchored ribosome-binding protein
MDKARIRTLLRSIHQSGGHLDDVDLEDRQLLQQLHDDIETLLELSSEVPAGHREEVRSGLSGAMDRLEENHPRLTRSIGHIAELLSGLGV